ncbi:hypothetical protein BJ742DRAFT_765633 [Cladochytrium replicatum]|nr:hypothetical protein BJ742DRAFT_765633 [Cladochytrium replicatum]
MQVDVDEGVQVVVAGVQQQRGRAIRRKRASAELDGGLNRALRKRVIPPNPGRAEKGIPQAYDAALFDELRKIFIRQVNRGIIHDCVDEKALEVVDAVLNEQVLTAMGELQALCEEADVALERIADGVESMNDSLPSMAGEASLHEEYYEVADLSRLKPADDGDSESAGGLCQLLNEILELGVNFTSYCSKLGQLGDQGWANEIAKARRVSHGLMELLMENMEREVLWDLKATYRRYGSTEEDSKDVNGLPVAEWITAKNLAAASPAKPGDGLKGANISVCPKHLVSSRAARAAERTPRTYDSRKKATATVHDAVSSTNSDDELPEPMDVENTDDSELLNREVSARTLCVRKRLASPFVSPPKSRHVLESTNAQSSWQIPEAETDKSESEGEGERRGDQNESEEEHYQDDEVERFVDSPEMPIPTRRIRL